MGKKGSPTVVAADDSTSNIIYKDHSYSREDQSKPARLRRCKSVTRAEQITFEENKVRKKQPDQPCHSPRDSLFSWSAQFTNYWGFVNWAFTLLILGGIRLSLENLLKYGILIDPPGWFYVINGGSFKWFDHYPSLYLLMYVQVHAMVALALEKMLAREVMNGSVGWWLHLINILGTLAVPQIGNYIFQLPLVGLSVMCFTCIVLAMKLYSYAEVNRWCRDYRDGKTRHRYRSLSYHKSMSMADFGAVADGEGDSGSGGPQSNLVMYPENLTLTDLYYFLVAPTLCYELNFPRTQRRRVWFLARRVIEFVCGINILVALFQQWIIPTVRNSLKPFSIMAYGHMVERWLKLAVPNHLLWLMLFYLFFHSFLNIVGEISMFADRNFYQDWWNAEDIGDFWRFWNIPVHRWAARHVYTPMVKARYGRLRASAAVFFLSAAGHEYLVGLPLQMLRIWAFSGMMAQLPLWAITRTLRHQVSPRLGNVAVWLSLIIGQPLAIMMYYHDYIILHHGQQLNSSH